MFRSHSLAVASALLGTILWSSSWVLIRVGLDDERLAPITFAGLRYGLARAIMLGWVAARGSHRDLVRQLERGTVLRLVLLGIVFYTITQGAQFVAIDNQPAATTSLVLSFTALAVAFASGRSLGEGATRRQLVGASVVVVGAWTYFGGGLGVTTIGMVAALVALIANVTGSLLGRLVNRDGHLPAVLVTAISMAFGSSILVIVGFSVEGGSPLVGASVGASRVVVGCEYRLCIHPLEHLAS